MKLSLTTALVALACLLGSVSAQAQYRGPGYDYGRGGPGYPPPARQYDIPPGSYKASCHRIRFDGRMLTAQCRAVTGEWVPTALDYGSCRGWVENIDSQLVCRGRGRF